jgi:hypothetical protein
MSSLHAVQLLLCLKSVCHCTASLKLNALQLDWAASESVDEQNQKTADEDL